MKKKDEKEHLFSGGIFNRFLFSLPIIRERWERESQSRIVELVVDWNDIEWIGKTEGVDPLLIAEELKRRIRDLRSE